MDQILTPRQQEALNFVANTDIKSLAYTALALHGPVTYVGLQDLLHDHVDVNVTNFVTKSPNTFAQNGFADISLRTGGNGRLVRHFQAIDKQTALPVAGAMLDWSSQYPFSLETLLGTTGASSASRSPSNSLSIVQLFQHPTTFEQAYRPGEPTAQNLYFTSRFRRMVENGIIATHQPLNQYRIQNPDFQGRRSITTLSRLYQGVYSALGEAHQANPEQLWTTAELTQFVMAHAGFARTQERKVSRTLHQMSSSRHPSDAPGVLQKIEHQPTTYYVSEEWQAASAHIPSHVAQLGRDQSFQAAMSKRAQEILEDSPLATRLAQKTIDTSSYVHKKRQPKQTKA